MKHILTWVLMISIAIISCNDKCAPATAGIGLISFQSNETDTIVVRKFLKNSGFSSPLDSFTINESNTQYIRKNDTLEIFSSLGPEMGVVSTYDYEIYLPRVQKTFRLSDIDEDFRSDFKGFSCTKEQCLNSFKSYTVDGEKVAVTSSYFYFAK